MVFENEEAFSRARVVHRARTITSNDDALELMRDKSRYDPLVETLLMSADAPVLEGPGPGPDEQAHLVKTGVDEVVVEARLTYPGYLVLADTYYPGWRALDGTGKELRIYRADMTLRAIALPAGNHTVSFTYLPIDFRVGLFLSLTSLLLMAAIVLVNRVRTKH